MLYDYEFKKFFWLTGDNKLACASSTTGDEHGLIEGATVYQLDLSIQDVFTESLGNIVKQLKNS